LLQYVAVYCSVLQGVTLRNFLQSISLKTCVAVCCSVLQCIAVCCGVLHCVIALCFCIVFLQSVVAVHCCSVLQCVVVRVLLLCVSTK
jgi:hypothetical protein